MLINNIIKCIIFLFPGGYRIATGLKRRHPGLKVLISVGGDGTARLFSEMAQEPNRRSSFIESAVNFLREHDFDGLDLHWVYPGKQISLEILVLVSEQIRVINKILF